MTVNIVISSLSVVAVGSLSVLIYLLLHPEVIWKWTTVVYRVGYFITKQGSKKIVKYDIQGRINSFARVLATEISNYEPVGINIQWVKNNESPSDFFKDNKLVIRMRHHRDQDKNFVLATMVFISKSVLTRAKKYMSHNQKESLDLFIGKKLCQREKPRISERFFDEFFGPKTDSNKRIVELLDKYELIDRVGIFYSVLVQELNFLGRKVFSQPRNAKIVEEINRFINFLEGYSQREIGDDTVRQEFEGNYCRCGIVIIAKFYMRGLGKTEPYIKYIKSLVDLKLENIYLLGSAEKENKLFIEAIALEVQDKYGYLEHFSSEFKATVMKGGRRRPVLSFLVLLRSPNTIEFYDAELEARLFDERIKEQKAE